MAAIKFEKSIFLKDSCKIIFNKFQAAVGLAAQSMNIKYPDKETTNIKIKSWLFRFIIFLIFIKQYKYNSIFTSLRNS